MSDNLLAEMAGNVSALLESGCLADKAVFIFGHCNAAEKMIDLLLAGGVTPAAILDNNQSKQGQTYNGVPVRNPASIHAGAPSASAVLIASRAYAPMTAQLRRMRYRGEVHKVVDYNTFAEYSLSDEVFARKKERVLRGMETLARIRKAHEGRYLVVCPNNALGDVYLALAYLPEYRRRRRIGETVVAVTGHGCRQVAELFETAHVAVLERDSMDELVQAILFTDDENCIIAHHDRPYTDNIIKYLDRRFLSFADYYRIGVYGLERDTEPTPPAGHAPYAGVADMPERRSLILSPYAKSVVQLPHDFWVDFAGKFAAEGLLVYTNVVGDEEPIRGTIPLAIPLNQIVSAAEHAGHFAGVRNGLCDVVADAKCRKMVFFPDCIYSTTNVGVCDFFGMPGWENYVVDGVERRFGRDLRIPPMPQGHRPTGGSA